MWAYQLKTLLLALVLGGLPVGAPAKDRLRLEPPADSGYPSFLAFSPDGKILACGTSARAAEEGGERRPAAAGDVLLWDTREGALVARLTGHTGSVDSLAWSPDGKTLCSVSNDDETILVWDVLERTRRSSLAMDGRVERLLDSGASIKVSPDGRTLVAIIEKSAEVRDILVRQGRVATAWDLEEGTLVWTVPSPGTNAVAISPNGKAVALSRGSILSFGLSQLPRETPRIEIRDLRNGKLHRGFTPPMGFWTDDLYFTRDGRKLVGISSGGVEVYDLASGERTVTRTWHYGGIPRGAFLDRYSYSPAREVVVRGRSVNAQDGKRLHFDLLELKKGKIVAEADGPKLVSGLALSPTLDRYAYHRAVYARREVVIRSIPWQRK